MSDAISEEKAAALLDARISAMGMDGTPSTEATCAPTDYDLRPRSPSPPQVHAATPRSLAARRPPPVRRWRAEAGGAARARCSPAQNPLRAAPLERLYRSACHRLTPASSLPQPPHKSMWRYVEFGGIYLCYMCFLMARKNYGFWLPSVLSELELGKAAGGTLGSTFEITYGACALLNGPLIDAVSPKYLLAVCLLLSGLCSVGIAATDSLTVMIALWGFNGFLQSFGWPSVTNVFLAWFPDPASRGAWYSLLSTCQNAGAALVPLLVSMSMSSFGWRAALYTPAAVGTVISALLALVLYGSPSAFAERGQPAVDDEGSPSPGGRMRRRSWVERSQGTRPANLGAAIKNQVLLNGSLWLMALNYFAISMVRAALADWAVQFLEESKGLPMSFAARCLFLMESGGFAGSLLAGAASDRLFQGRRGPVVCTCTALLAPSLLLLGVAQTPELLQLTYVLIGFFAFPVHVLLGLFSREVVPKALGSSAGGFVKAIAQVGGAFAGLPLGLLQRSLGWEGVISGLAIVVATGAVGAVPLWRVTAGENKIIARHGTVADFSKMQRVASLQEKLGQKGKLD